MSVWLPLLLADPSPCLRCLVLRELLGKPSDDPEVLELEGYRKDDLLVADPLSLQTEEGWFPGADPIRQTAHALARLGYLGFGLEHPGVRRAAEALFSAQAEDGSWPLPGAYGRDGESRDAGYDMIPLQTALPLRGLAASGYAEDPRAELGYEWLLAQRLPDGAWPTGMASGNYGRVAGYRRLPHSGWGCRSNTTGALLCLALHPRRRSGAAARQALDLLLGRETREAQTMGFEVARLVGAEAAGGIFTHYAIFDLALLLDLCWRVGATLEDPRVAGLVEFVRSLAGPYGLWEYGPRPQASRWVTFDLLRSLSRLDSAGEWISLAPRTPFQPYPTPPRRY